MSTPPTTSPSASQPTGQPPPHYIQRESAESFVGKSPKTIYRRIKQAIETPGAQTAGMLEHCCVQLLDGEVIDGTHVASMTQVDEYRRKGRVPMWYIDPDFFRAYFEKTDKRRGGSSRQRETTAPVDNGSLAAQSSGQENTASLDPAIIEQYETRLRDKDDQIQELRTDKVELRKQLSANTNLTERITGLLSHSQLAALGVPEGWQPAPATEGNQETTKREVVVVEEQSPKPPTRSTPPKKTTPPKSPAKPKAAKKSGSRKPGQTKASPKQKKATKADAKKPDTKKWYHRDVRSFFG